MVGVSGPRPDLSLVAPRCCRRRGSGGHTQFATAATGDGLAAVFLGYGAEKLGKPRRKPLEEVVHLNDWDVRYQREVRMP